MQHLAHLLVIGLPLLVLAGMVVREWRRGAPPRRASAERPNRGLRLAVAACVLGSGLVHLTVIRQHLRESALLGVFFVGLAVAQITVAVLVALRPWRPLLMALALGQAGVVALWAWTRLVGVPFGLAGGEREVVGVRDLLATALEAATVLGALLLLRPAKPGAPASRPSAAVLKG